MITWLSVRHNNSFHPRSEKLFERWILQMQNCSAGDEQLDFYQTALNLPQGYTGEHVTNRDWIGASCSSVQCLVFVAGCATLFTQSQDILPTVCFLFCLFLMWPRALAMVFQAYLWDRYSKKLRSSCRDSQNPLGWKRPQDHLVQPLRLVASEQEGCVPSS